MGMVKIADLKNNLSRHLARVKNGGQLTVLDRDTPIARIVPFVPASGTPEDEDPGAAGRIAALTRQGILAPGDTQAVAAWSDAHPPVRVPAGSPSAVNLLLEMRRRSER
jgi:antitoxin (DNA-binding transcriptional repressor) of toxin-antitoxin stability system